MVIISSQGPSYQLIKSSFHDNIFVMLLVRLSWPLGFKCDQCLILMSCKCNTTHDPCLEHIIGSHVIIGHRSRHTSGIELRMFDLYIVIFIADTTYILHKKRLLYWFLGGTNSNIDEPCEKWKQFCKHGTCFVIITENEWKSQSDGIKVLNDQCTKTMHWFK